VGCAENKWTDNFAPFYEKLANVALPYGDLTADKIGVGIAIATGAAIAGHAVGKAVRGQQKAEGNQ
jgi:hydrogenase small subunit